MSSPVGQSMGQALSLRFLGEMEVARDGEPIALPPSKKTRALLAYLAMTGRSHRRARLCSLFWDVADDPRGALRWSLSKLRSLVDSPDEKLLETDRDNVLLRSDAARIDVLAVRSALAHGVDDLGVSELEALAAEFRGEFLEGLELSDFHDFQAWCIAERDESRKLQVTVLESLISRLRSKPELALPHARKLVQCNPLDEAARATLISLLAELGRLPEAEQHYRAAVRMAEELGSTGTGRVLAAWQQARRGNTLREVAPAPLDLPPVSVAAVRLVGRESERARLVGLVEEVRDRRHARVLLIGGEPGMGKSRMLEELRKATLALGGSVLSGSAYEAESGHPYGPWIDALRQVKKDALDPTLATALAPLLPGLEAPSDREREGTRDQMFGAVVELLSASAPPLCVVLDDVQWCDEASVALLHFVARTCRHRPLLVAMAARTGELVDNVALSRVLRSLRRERLLEELRLEPLGPESTRELVAQVGSDLDPERVYEDSSGNPLLALEVARFVPQRDGEVPQSLKELVLDRVDRLPTDAASVLRWCAVLGKTFSVQRLQSLVSTSPDQLVEALELLERHALLEASAEGDHHEFCHDLVRNVVYVELSEPRRRLMHSKVAQALAAQAPTDERVAAEIAHHASLAGEALMAARACAAAGRRCLRLFANGEADALARRGLRLAEQLEARPRVELMLELLDVGLAARRPADTSGMSQTIEALAEEALAQGSLEHARLGFHMLSTLRWEEGEWNEAKRYTLRAEMVSRAADESERVVAMAETARCLTLLERDLPQADTLLMEANALAKSLGMEPRAIPHARGMLHLYAGELDEAMQLFEHARDLCHRDGDRLGEYQAIEHQVMLELARGRADAALALTDALCALGDKLREGSEGPFAHVLGALCRYTAAPEHDTGELDRALDVLRSVDAKFRLAYALSRAALVDLRQGESERAAARASEALAAARLLDRKSEMALALSVLARCQTASEPDGAHLGELELLLQRGLAAEARDAVKNLLGGEPPGQPAREPR